MSPHGIAGTPIQIDEIRGISVNWSDPYPMNLRRALTKSVRDIRCRKFVLSGKVDQRSPKSLKICYAPMPAIVPNFIALGQTVYEKSVTFLHPSLVWRRRGFLGPKFTSLGDAVLQGPLYQSEKFHPVYDHPCTRYLFPKFVYFADD